MNLYYLKAITGLPFSVKVSRTGDGVPNVSRWNRGAWDGLAPDWQTRVGPSENRGYYLSRIENDRRQLAQGGATALDLSTMGVFALVDTATDSARRVGFAGAPCLPLAMTQGTRNLFGHIPPTAVGDLEDIVALPELAETINRTHSFDVAIENGPKLQRKQLPPALQGARTVADWPRNTDWDITTQKFVEANAAPIPSPSVNAGPMPNARPDQDVRQPAPDRAPMASEGPRNTARPGEITRPDDTARPTEASPPDEMARAQSEMDGRP